MPESTFKMSAGVYNQVVQELVELEGQKRFVGNRSACRYCGTKDEADFGRRSNAHLFPMALGNRVLFTLDECKACNHKFSIYEDALTKAVGPFLTLGGVRGRKGVRQTGLSKGKSKIRHSSSGGKRRLSVTSNRIPHGLFKTDHSSGVMTIRLPVEGDAFVPRYAYKALLKIAVSILPEAELPNFTNAIGCLTSQDDIPHDAPLQVGFSYALVGNAPPVLAGCLLRRSKDELSLPYMIFVFMAGSLCFQIWVKSDKADAHVPNVGKLGIQYTAQLPIPERGYLPVRFSDPRQFDWSDNKSIHQPFGFFDLRFNPHTQVGKIIPVPRR